ncbi:hypothetical protein [Saccharomonospora halophila]|uniref:hypothetical protein n=1 Tax=Saccharomonospora halophila TaxID=129922 RepID=UPI00035C4ABE|nr:hypothetical protein [Saccharomonospora halophila]
MLLDDILPRWDHRERHELRVGAPTEDVLAAVESMTWKDLPVLRALSALSPASRRPPHGRAPFLDRMTAGGFRVLHRGPDELVVGAVAPVRRGGRARSLDPDPCAAFVAFTEPGHYRVAFNFRHAGGVLGTETRVAVTNPDLLRAFTRYWRLIRLPGGLIRREWLRAIRTAAVTPNG